MEWYIKDKPTQADLDKIFSAMKVDKKGVNVRKYAGKVKSKENPVTLQRKLRDEWD